MAKSILGSSPEAQAQLKDLYGKIQDISENGVTALATQMNDGTHLATTALTKEYAQVAVDLQKALTEASNAMAKAKAEQVAKFAADMAAAQKTLEDAMAAAKKTLDEGLADEALAYANSLEDMNTTLKNGLFDADKALKKALLDSATQFNSAVDKLQKDTLAKLAELQKQLATTAAQIAAVAGASAAVSMMANSPAAPYLAGTTPLIPSGTSSTTQTGVGEHSGNMGVVINQTVHTTATDPSSVTNSTLAAINLGMPSLMSGTSLRGN